jgi:N-ethylmaleimide reductase
VERLATGAPLALPDLSKAYGGDERGYTDYPTLADSGQERAADAFVTT